jgi:hypothetical protein
MRIRARARKKKPKEVHPHPPPDGYEGVTREDPEVAK